MLQGITGSHLRLRRRQFLDQFHRNDFRLGRPQRWSAGLRFRARPLAKAAVADGCFQKIGERRIVLQAPIGAAIGIREFAEPGLCWIFVRHGAFAKPLPGQLARRAYCPALKSPRTGCFTNSAPIGNR